MKIVFYIYFEKKYFRIFRKKIKKTLNMGLLTILKKMKQKEKEMRILML